MPADSVDLVVTSPPFLALRSYLPADHPDKGKEIGSEATPGAFIDVLLDVVEELDRVLAPHGSICIELGDTYSSSGGSGGDYAEGGMREGQPAFDGSARRTRTNNLYNTENRYSDEWNKGNTAGKPIEGIAMNGGPGWPEAKSLCMIPQSFAWALAYGRNPFTGRETPRWRVRNIIRWCRSNPPVGALGDKFRPATSEMVVACKSRTRYFDLDSVRTEPQVQMGRAVDGNNVKGSDASSFRFAQRVDSNPAGAPPLDFWVIPTAPYKGSHYATFPPALITKPIESMTPRRVCRVCGEPSRRITEPTEEYAEHLGSSWADRDDGRTKASGTERNSHSGQPVGAHITAASRTTSGWTDCGCCWDAHPEFERPEILEHEYCCDDSHWRRGVVLDPFGGSGTTGAVATGHGRDAILCDLDERNAELAIQRLGMFLTVERHAPPEQCERCGAAGPTPHESTCPAA